NAKQTVVAMKGAGGGRAIQADVADSAQVKAMFATIEREIGTLDILVNNAGIAFGPGDDRKEIGRKAEAVIMEMVTGQGVQTHMDITENLSDESWRRMLAVHLDGTFFCTREALRLMSRRNSGAIVNLSSVAALMGLEAVPHYSAAKGGILAFTRAAARDVAQRDLPGLHHHADDRGDRAPGQEGGARPHAARPLRRGPRGGRHGAVPRQRRQLVLHRPVAVSQRRPLHRLTCRARASCRSAGRRST